jgi:Domain of unknown function (DUF4287)/YjbR
MKIDSIRRHALSLEAVTEEPHHHFSSFRVRGKIFVTIPPDDAFVHVFVGDEDRESALALYPAFTEKLLWGGKVLGLRVALAKAKPSMVKALVNKAYDTRVRKDASPKSTTSPRKAGAEQPPATGATMTTEPKVKGPAAYFPSIEKTYGHPIAHWMSVLEAAESRKHMEYVSLLKTKHQLGHGHANALVAHFLAER